MENHDPNFDYPAYMKELEDSRSAPCSARPDYPPNVEHFIAKWQPLENPRRKAFWKEFRKAANAYAEFKQNTHAQPPKVG